VLDTEPDDLGRQFRFIVNGVPIFAKGADWIPSDSFVTRTTRDDYAFYIQSAKHAGMNMLRVWGGGMYERDDFYDLCDENGILVWQDFIFACGSYPLYEKEFLENVHGEVIDNVRRLRHHASLALWCGNNECEIMQMLWKRKKHIYESNRSFYHTILRGWVGELDDVTPYWPGSPSSGSLDDKVHQLKPGKIFGDTHLWQVWHGMDPIEAFRNFPTRFCSEFGMESMPSMHTIRMFTDNPSPGLFDPVMKLHQKSKGGNEKILLYLLAKYRNPKKFEDYIYLTQLVQANTVRFATDCWRRNIGKQNGAIYWQYNDCWPVASWAGIDYGKQYKAVQYHAKHFNKMICLSNDYFDDRAEIYAVNEFPDKFSGVLEWTLSDFKGAVYSRGSENVDLEGVTAKRLNVLHYSEICKKLAKKNAVLRVTLKKGGTVVDSKNWLLVPDRKAALPKAHLTYRCSLRDGIASVELTADYYARYVYLEAKGVTSPWSDNFFDLAAGESVTVTVPLPADMDLAAFQKALTVKSLADVEPKNGLLKDRLLRISMVLKENNYITWLLFKILMIGSK
jgi:beta-mannosidase